MRTVALITGDDRIEAVAFAKTAARDCLAKGDIPINLQLMNLEGFSDQEIATVYEALKDWQARADAVVVYDDLGLSEKMQAQIDELRLKGKQVETRKSAIADPKDDAVKVKGI